MDYERRSPKTQVHELRDLTVKGIVQLPENKEVVTLAMYQQYETKIRPMYKQKECESTW